MKSINEAYWQKQIPVKVRKLVGLNAVRSIKQKGFLCFVCKAFERRKKKRIVWFVSRKIVIIDATIFFLALSVFHRTKVCCCFFLAVVYTYMIKGKFDCIFCLRIYSIRVHRNNELLCFHDDGCFPSLRILDFSSGFK